MGLPYNWFIGKVSSLEINMEEVSLEDQLAEQFTKQLGSSNFEKQ